MPWKVAAYMHSSGITVRQWAKENNVCYFNIRQHILDDMTPDEACNYAQKRKGKHDTKSKYFINEVNLKEYCRQHNLKYDTIRCRCQKMTIEEAVTKPININKRRNNYGR